MSYMGKRGEYRPPNGSSGMEFTDVSSLFSDPKIAWPKRAHWWHYVEENETFALWLLNAAAGSYTTAIEQARVLARFLDIMNWSLDRSISWANKINHKRRSHSVSILCRDPCNYRPKRGERHLKLEDIEKVE